MVNPFAPPPSQPGPVNPQPTPPVVVVEYNPGPNDVQLLPDGTWGFPNFVYTPRRTLNSVSRPKQLKTQQISVIGEGNPIRITVGRDSIGGDIVDVWSGAGHLFVVVGWGHGAIEAIEEVWIGDSLYTGDRNDYLGANTEPVDPYISGEHPSYTFNPVDRAFSVLRIHPSFTFQTLNIRAVIKGRNDIWDPRLNGGAGDFAYTENASLIRAWFRSTFMGETINDADLTICADWSDDLLETPLEGDETQDRGKYRHHIGRTWDVITSKYRVDAELAELSQTFLAHDGDVIRLIPNRDGPAVATLGPGDMIAGSETSERLRPSRRPNVETVVYSQIVDGEPWRDATFSTPFPFPGPAREAETRMPAFQHLATAQRWDRQRIAFSNTTSWRGRFKTRDEGLRRLIGDIVNYSDSQGLSGIKARLLNSYPTGKGEWTIEWQEHDPDAYVEDYVPAPDTDPIGLPNPNEIPVGPTPTSVSEKLWTDSSGRTFSVAIIKWDQDIWPFARFYHVKVYSVTETIYQNLIPANPAIPNYDIQTQPTQQGVQYTIEISIINPFGQEGPPSQTLYTGNQNVLPPTDVDQSSMVSYEFGQFVTISHNAAQDTDLEGYRWKRLADADFKLTEAFTDENWTHTNAQQLLERYDAPQVQFGAQPEGTFWYGVKAVDSRGNVSVNAAWVKQQVTVEAAGAVSFVELGPGASLNMNVYENFGATIGGVYAHTDFNESFADLFVNTGGGGTQWPADPDESFVEQTPSFFDSWIESEEWDTGADRSGQWYGRLAEHFRYSSGASLAEHLYHATEAAYPTFTLSLVPVTQARARYAKIRAFKNSVTAPIRVKFPARVSFQGVILVDELTVNVPASPQPHSFTWTKDFTDPPTFSYSLISAEPVVVGFENIDADGGDVRAWAAAGHSTLTPGDPAPVTLNLTATGP